MIGLLALISLGMAVASELVGSPKIEALKRHVHALADNPRPRSHLDLKRLNAVGDYIFAELESQGFKPSFQKYAVDGVEVKNVRALIGKGRGRMVIGAHYDACFDTPGADDNASGVAGLLELARLLKMNEKSLPRSVEIVFYTLEEPPWFGTDQMGSAVHARRLREANTQVDLMLSIEMIGRFSDRPNSQKYPAPFMSWFWPTVGNYIAVVGRWGDRSRAKTVQGIFRRETDLPMARFNLPQAIRGISFSDHRNYWRHGFPALMVTDTAFMRNGDYHEQGDTADKLDYIRMAKVVRGLLPIPFHYEKN